MVKVVEVEGSQRGQMWSGRARREARWSKGWRKIRQKWSREKEGEAEEKGIFFLIQYISECGSRSNGRYINNK